MFVAIDGNSLDKLRHTRSVAYSVELVLLNKHQISGGGAYPDCYPIDRLSHKTCSLWSTAIVLHCSWERITYWFTSM